MGATKCDLGKGAFLGRRAVDQLGKFICIHPLHVLLAVARKHGSNVFHGVRTRAVTEKGAQWF